ncbi:uncharacterized protein LOC135344926 [Halichondria panicea]|uniref:uncharacterized protein LOC135344926 n=1 Tax=Halichondria panicea TaxID=6063 RepID=UPI00312BC984
MSGSFLQTRAMATIQDRAAGAIMGAMIGDALGLGCHWYYNLDQLKREYGEWIDDYTTAKPGRYHYGCKAGDVSQSGQLFQYLLETLNEKGEYSEEDFCTRLDGFLATLDGTREGGRYTQKDVCDVWKNRVVLKKPWGECASPFGDTTDSCVRAVALAARYHNDLPTLVKKIGSNSILQYQDRQVQVHSIAFGLTVACLISGMEYSKISSHLMNLIAEGKIPFTSAMALDRDSEENTPEPDSLLWSGYAAKAVANLNLRIEPARDAPQMYGLSCAFYMLMPGAYYLAARFPDNFETAVLTAVNSGGQNLARASLTGGMVGAITGLSSFPDRFIKGLTDGDKWVEVAKKIAQDGAKK